MADQADLKLRAPEQVALELMHFIADIEVKTDKEGFEKPDARTYYLTLYNQCIRAGIYHYSGNEILEGRQRRDPPRSSSHSSF
jgi:hypothetical protein